MKIDIPRQIGSVNVSIDLPALTLADGSPFALNHDTAGLELWYRREGAVEVDFTSSIQALAGLNAAHADGGVEPYAEIEGLARVDPPDAAFASSGGGTEPKFVMIGGKATGKVIIPVKVPLTSNNIYSSGFSAQQKADILAEINNAFAVQIEDGPNDEVITRDVALLLLIAIAAGVRTGFGGAAPTLKNPKGTKSRVVAEDADADGNAGIASVDVTP